VNVLAILKRNNSQGLTSNLSIENLQQFKNELVEGMISIIKSKHTQIKVAEKY
jgi:hypothetical protein